MLTFQHSDFSEFMMVPGEDPMELSTDMEKRFLGDEDIDIDLSPDGRSPYGQEDEYMLEDDHFTNDQRLHHGQQGGNDDEMADEIEGATEEMERIQEDQSGDNFQEADEFDLLVDDEELQDVEDTVLFSDGITGPPPTFPFPVGESSQQPMPSQLPVQYGSNHADSTYRKIPHHDEAEKHTVDFKHAYVRDPVQVTDITTTITELTDTTVITTEIPQQTLFQEQSSPSQIAEASFPGFPTEALVESRSITQPCLLVQEETEGTEASNDRHSKGSPIDNELRRGSPNRNLKHSETVAEQTILKDHVEPEAQSGIRSRNRDAPHSNPAGSGTETEEMGAAIESFEGQGKDSAPEFPTSLNDPHPLHPVIVVYQESEILLFPPCEEEQAQTYFLEDESLAGRTIQSLLGACRLVLADSINDDEELELKITSLGLEICETSIASTTTSLIQILEVYLKLQHNDGIDDPDPLHMSLIRKLNFPHRMEFLSSAVAGGTGFLEVAQSSKAEYERMSELQEGSEHKDDHLQGKAESFASEADAALEEESTLIQAHDWKVNEFHAPHADTNNHQELNPAGPIMKPTLHEHTVEGKGQQVKREVPSVVDTPEKSSRPENLPRENSTQPKQDEVQTFSDAALYTESFYEISTAKKESNSPASSTLRGGSSDFASDHNPRASPSALTPVRDNGHFTPSELETGEDFLAIVDTEEPERSNATYEDDGDLFDLEEHEDADEAHGANQDQRGSEDPGSDYEQTVLRLHFDGNQATQEDHHDVQDGPATPSMSREASKDKTDVDNDEITYDDEDEEVNEANNHEEGDAKSPGTSPGRQSDNESLENNHGTLGGPREFLKRLRPGEDGELAQADEKQDSKRFRAE